MFSNKGIGLHTDNQLVFSNQAQGCRTRYDIMDNGHEKKTFKCFMEVSYKLWCIR